MHAIRRLCLLLVLTGSITAAPAAAQTIEQFEAEEMPAGEEAPSSVPELPADTKKAPEEIKKEEQKPPPSESSSPYHNGIRLQGLNKVTARSQTLEGPVGVVLTFGNLEIIPRRCWKAPPEERPENAAFLEIWEYKPGEGPQRIFLGWMFSSSPALSSLEHPVYDVTVLTCQQIKDDPNR